MSIGKSSPGPERDQEAIRAVREGFAEAYAAGDVSRLLAYYHEAYVDMSVGSETRGRPDMRRAFEETFRRYDGDLDIRPAEVLVQGDWAIERGSFTIRLVDRATGDESISHRRYLEVLVREGEGWCIFRDLDNEVASTAGDPPEEARS